MRAIEFIIVVFITSMLLKSPEGICQSNPFHYNRYTDNTITLSDPDTIFIFQVTSDRAKVKINVDYYWFSNGQLSRTTGGYSGKLLNGRFEKKNRKSKLIEQGGFKNGLKIGTWLQWYETGSPLSQVEWKNSVRSGNFVEYYPGGAIMRSGRYASGKLQGRVTLYAEDGSIIMSDRYNKGVFVEDKVKLPKTKSISSDSAKVKRPLVRRKRINGTPPASDAVQPIVSDTTLTPVERPFGRRNKKNKTDSINEGL